MSQARSAVLIGVVGLFALITGWTDPVCAEQIIQDVSGRGHQHLEPFTVQDGWELRWELTGDDSILQVVIDKFDGAGIDVPVDTVTREGPATGKNVFAKGGTYYLRVIGIGGSWKVTVVQVP